MISKLLQTTLSYRMPSKVGGKDNLTKVSEIWVATKLEVAAIEEVTTTAAEPGRSVVGMFDRFKRTIDKKVLQKNRQVPYIVP